MWTAIKAFFSANAVVLMEKGALLLGLLGAVATIYRAGSRAEQNDNLNEELGHAKEALKQDAVVAGNGDIDGMRDRLSQALRRKRNS